MLHVRKRIQRLIRQRQAQEVEALKYTEESGEGGDPFDKDPLDPSSRAPVVRFTENPEELAEVRASRSAGQFEAQRAKEIENERLAMGCAIDEEFGEMQERTPSESEGTPADGKEHTPLNEVVEVTPTDDVQEVTPNAGLDVYDLEKSPADATPMRDAEAEAAGTEDELTFDSPENAGTASSDEKEKL